MRRLIVLLVLLAAPFAYLDTGIVLAATLRATGHPAASAHTGRRSGERNHHQCNGWKQSIERSCHCTNFQDHFYHGHGWHIFY